MTHSIDAAERVIFDTDSGFFNDDGAALVMLARSPRSVTIEALTLVTGNVWSRQGAEYMFHTLKLLGRERTPLYMGADLPLVQTAPMSQVASARWGPFSFRGAFEKPPGKIEPPFGGKFTGLEPQARSAIDYLIETIGRNPGQITVLALGPMTNLAIALRLRPGIETKIKQLVFMGGNVRVPGNSSPAAEFNFWFDPEAAQIVLRSAIPKKIMFPLDICNRAIIRKQLFNEVAAAGSTPVLDLYKEDMGVVYPGFYKNPDAGRPLWDELAAAWLIDPSFVTKRESLYLDVDARFGKTYGATIPLDRELAPLATPVDVMFDLDFPRLFALYKDLLTR